MGINDMHHIESCHLVCAALLVGQIQPVLTKPGKATAGAAIQRYGSSDFQRIFVSLAYVTLGCGIYIGAAFCF
jgi:hypothetical protein